MLTAVLAAFALLLWPCSQDRLRAAVPASPPWASLPVRPTSASLRVRPPPAPAGTGRFGGPARTGARGRFGGLGWTGRRVGFGGLVGTAGGGRWLLAPVGSAAVLAGLAGPAVGAAAGIAAGTAGLLVRSELRGRRELRELADLLTAVRTLAREVRAGTGPAAAIAATAAAHPNSAGVLDGVAAAVARTHGAAESIGGVGPAADVAGRLISVWTLSTRYGVPWAALVDTVAQDIADRLRAASQRTAQVAGPKLSGYVLAAMPALGVLLGSGMGADPVHVLLHTGAGQLMLLAGVCLTCLGLAWSARIVRGR